MPAGLGSHLGGESYAAWEGWTSGKDGGGGRGGGESSEELLLDLARRTNTLTDHIKNLGSEMVSPARCTLSCLADPGKREFAE